ncbi:hypothetical protein [Streptomyces sasae]|uniref:hypothetical protein n=1 Tax=Streptomyces sasae TaxID=1266772 RepID=UPI002930A9C7|nr:hypothetical protein [Streptomyces sasae]
MTVQHVTTPGGGIDLTVSLTPDEARAIGITEAESLVDYLDTALWGLALLRSGRTVRTPESREVTADDLHHLIRDLHAHLVPIVTGIEDAAIRRHRELGGTTGALAAAMDVARSTAQRRRESLDNPGPRQTGAAHWEAWASTPREQH